VFANPFHELTLRLVADGLVAPNAGTWIGVPAIISLVPLALIVGALLGPALRALGGWRIFAIAASLAFAILLAYRWLPSTKNPDEPYRRILPAIRAAQL
jgi:predicted MFS family arabinose efflux permease